MKKIILTIAFACALAAHQTKLYDPKDHAENHPYRDTDYHRRLHHHRCHATIQLPSDALPCHRRAAGRVVSAHERPQEVGGVESVGQDPNIKLTYCSP